MSSTGNHKPRLASQDPFLTGAIPALRVAGDGRHAGFTRLDRFRYTPLSEKHTYSAGELVASFPLLMAGASVAAFEDPHKFNADLPEGERQAFAARIWKRNLMSGVRLELLNGSYQPRPPRQRQIPKQTYSQALPSLPVLMETWADPAGHFHDPTDPTKTRTLSISHWTDKAIQSSLNIVLSAYLSPQWRPGVVGFRGGISIPMILIALEQALRKTKLMVALMVDIRDFFGSVPLRRALELLEGRTHYRGDPLLRRILEMYLRSDGATGLPQGSSLSPLLANLYGAETIDRYWTTGPLLRYADDVVVLVESVAEAKALYLAMEKNLGGHGLRLHPDKSVIHDFRSATTCMAASGEPVASAVTYLGVEPTWDDGAQRLAFRCTDKAILKLFQGLKDVQPDHQRLTLENRGTHWIEAWAASRLRVMGWLAAYGGMEISAGQLEAVRLALWLPGLDGRRLAEQMAEAKYLGEGSETLLLKVAAAMGLSESEAKRMTWESVEPLGAPLDDLLHAGRAKIEALRASPLSLPYQMGGHTRHTAGKQAPMENEGIVCVPSDPAFCPSPMPKAEVVLESWCLRNSHGAGAQPSLQPEPLFSEEVAGHGACR